MGKGFRNGERLRKGDRASERKEAQREERGTEKEKVSGRGGKLREGVGPGLGCRFREG